MCLAVGIRTRLLIASAASPATVRPGRCLRTRVARRSCPSWKEAWLFTALSPEPLTLASLPSYLLRRRDGGVRKPRLPHRVVPPALRWPQLGSQGQVVLRGLPPLLHAVLKEVKEVEVSTASDLLLPRPLEFDALSANMDYEAFPGNHVHGVARGMARAS